MPSSKVLTIRMEDQPGILGNCCKTLAARGVNILAFQAVPSEGNSVVRMVVDNPQTQRKHRIGRASQLHRKQNRESQHKTGRASWHVSPRNSKKQTSTLNTPTAG
jgi:acetolactate synthase small subunit